nr:MAG TPA: hypothetical protein [Caudoviricetes sp.]
MSGVQRMTAKTGRSRPAALANGTQSRRAYA